MDFRITVEWDPQCGILTSKIFPILDGLKEGFKSKTYGMSISRMSVVMTCMGKDFKQRKRFRKPEGLLEYDILLDYFLIKNVDMEQKKNLIRQQMVNITEETLGKYKFDAFDKATFLSDFKEILYSVVW